MLDFFRKMFGLSDLARTAREEQRQIHRVKRVWTLSGVTATGDAGCWLTQPMTRDEALEYLGRINPRATVIHIDVVHWIITYRV